MTIAARTKASVKDELEAYLAARLPEIFCGPDTDIGARIAMLSEALYGLHAQIRAIEEDLFVSARTSTEALDKHAEARLEGGRKGATTSTGAAALRVSGTPSTSIPAGTELVAGDGTRFQLSASAVVESGGTVDVSIVSIDVGTAANRAIGETLTFVSAPAGITATAELVAAVSGAEDAESDGALVRRLLDAYQNPPAGGRFSDWRQWATEVTGVDSAYAYGPSVLDANGRRGVGIVDLVICAAGTGAARVPSASVKVAVEANIEDNRPAMTADFGVVLPTVVEQDVLVVVTPKTGYAFDWDPAVPGSFVAVSAWTPSTKELQTSFAYPSDLEVGDRVHVAGQLATVTALDLSGAPAVYKITIDTELQGTIVGQDIIPGGPLTQPVLDAIAALFDSLGPARGTAADPDQDWDDTLRLSSIFDAVMDVLGVKDVTITTPLANVTPSDTGATIELLVAGSIIVEPA